MLRNKLIHFTAAIFILPLSFAFGQTPTEVPTPNPDPQLLQRTRSEIRNHYSKVDSIQDFSIEDLAPFDGLVKVVLNPQEGFLAKILKIRQAQYTIDCSYYIFTPDRAGYTLLHEISDALKRGVNVRIMVDALGSPRFFHGELKALFDVRAGFMKDASGKVTNQRAHIEEVLFNPIFHMRVTTQRWYAKMRGLATGEPDTTAQMSYFRNRRSHDKILAVDIAYPDLALVMIGGRNIAEAYFGVPTLTAQTYNDLEVIVRPLPHDQKDMLGVAVSDYFDKLYFHLGNKFLSRHFGASVTGLYKSQLARMDKSSNEVLDSPSISKKLNEMENQNYFDKGFEKISVNFINEIENISRTKAFINPNGIQNKKNGASITEHIHLLMKNAVSSIDIVSPYVYLYPEEIKMLQAWLDADPHRRLRILTNSIQTTDNFLAQTLVDNVLGPAFMKNPQWPNARKQAQVYSLGRTEAAKGIANSYGKLHAKFTLIDGKYAVVGTSNGDPRSRYLNSEVGFLLTGGQPLAELQSYAESLANRSSLWGSPEWEKIRSSGSNILKVPLTGFLYTWIRVFGVTPIL